MRFKYCLSPFIPVNIFQKKKDITIKGNSFSNRYQRKIIFIILFVIGITIFFYQSNYKNYYVFAEEINNTSNNNY